MTWQPRYSVLLILFTAYLLCYLDRMAMASAIPFIAREFHLSPSGMGAVLSAFFAGYAFMQIPGGLLADKLGARRLLTAAILAWSVCTAITGAARSLTAMLLIRVLFGLSEGPFPPAASKAIVAWFPQRAVGRANGILLASVTVGAACAPVFVTTVVTHWGWRPVFYSLLPAGLILAILVWAFVKDSPQEALRESRSELRELIGQSINARPSPLGPLLRSRSVIWCATALFLGSLAAWGLVNWLPTYLLQARGFNVEKMGYFATLPALSGAVGYCLGGYISDRYFSQRRHLPIVLGSLLGGAATYLAARAPTGEWAVAYLTVAFLFMYVASAGLLTLPLVLVPKETVGSAFGIVNTAGQVAGFLSPLWVGAVLEANHQDFTRVFYGFVGLFLAAAGAALCIKPTGAAADASS